MPLVQLDPGATASGGVVYTKTVTSDELFYENNAGSISELSCIKAWCSFNGATLAILDSYNIDTITRTANPSGDYNIKFLTNLTNANYAVFASGSPVTTSIFAPAVGQFRLATYTNSHSLANYTYVTVLVIGH